MTTYKKAKIIAKHQIITVMCPTCGLEENLDIGYFIHRKIANIVCDECDTPYEVDIFKCFDRDN